MSRRPVRTSRRSAGARKERSARVGRFSLLLVCFALASTAIAVRLVHIQLVAGRAYAAAAADQRTRDLKIAPERGMILDREHEVLAESVEAKSIYAVPSAIADKEGTARALAGILGGDERVYLARLNKDASFVWIARKVDVDRAEAVQGLGIRGLGFLRDSRRVYPSNELACQVLGYVGVDDEGLAGLEKHYDDLLAGTPGRLIGERDESGRVVIPGAVTYQEDPVNGKDIVLTIDKDIQYQAQMALEDAVKTWGAKGGSVVIMDPANGEILAMASSPAYDPNRFSQAEERAKRNRPIVDTYEPGSTMKSFTAAAVIDRGLYRSESVFELPPTIRVGGRTIHEAHPRPTVHWTLTEIVTNSSNVGAVKLGQALGVDGVYEYFRRFGLTEKTGVDFPGEAAGRLAPPKEWSPSSIATIPFGQGMSVTSLQLARALAVIANGGTLVTPHFLKAVPDEPALEFDWPQKRSIDASTCATMRAVLTDVVNEGTGEAAAVPGYQVAGKTGTAKKARTDGRAGYAPGKYVASFSGFIPAGEPRVLIVVCIDEPSKSIYGGTVAAPTFSRLAAYCVDHLKIPPGAPVTGASQGEGQ